ncbi:hypothetical protein ABIC94_003735 [Variovorax paradoxus]
MKVDAKDRYWPLSARDVVVSTPFTGLHTKLQVFRSEEPHDNRLHCTA